jgi:cell division protein FtsN
MPRDYKARANPRPARRPAPCWVWFSVGVLLGGFGFALAWLKLGSGAGGTGLVVPGLQQPATKPQAARQRDPEPTTRPRFDFYTILPEMEVVVPKEESSPASPPGREPTPGAEPPAPATARESYILQVGSFRKHADADRLKARLALMGIEADIQKVTIDNKDTYHRVRSGPYRSRPDLDRVRAQLKREGIDSVAIKLQG